MRLAHERAQLPPTLDAALSEARRRVAPLGDPVFYYPEIGSTNDIAAGLATKGAAEGTTIIADAQTAGRGRLGRSWCSPPGAGLYVSIILRPESGAVQADGEGANRWPMLTLAAGVALARAVARATGLHIELKWPNDLVVRSQDPHVGEGLQIRKLAGILADAHVVGAAIRHVILGYGINLRRTTYPPELADLATSIEAECGDPPDRDAVLVATLEEMVSVYRVLLRGGARDLLAEWASWSPLSVGARVRWDEAGTCREGVTSGIDHDGALLVQTPLRNERIVSGPIAWL